MIRSEKCLRRWYLSVKRLSECRLNRWTRCISRLRHHQLRKGNLKLNIIWLKWRNVKLGLSLLKATLKVYSTLHLSYLSLLLNSGICLSLSPSLCRCYIFFPYPRTIWGLLKFHPPHGLITIHIISTKGLKVCLSPQVNIGILEHSDEEATIGEYADSALATSDHVHHRQVPQVDPFPSQNRINKEGLIVRDLISMSTPW